MADRLLDSLERRLGLTPSGALVLTLAAAGWLLARPLGAAAMMLLAYGALLVVAVSWALGRRRLAVTASRSDLPARVREGQHVDVVVQLQAGRRVSGVILEEELPGALGIPVRVPVPLLGAGRQVRHGYSFSPRLRGVYRVGPLVATWSDPFGLTRRRLPLAEATEIIVHPAVERVHDRVLTRAWEDPPIRPPVSKPWPTGFEFYGMREYVPGDDPRRVVWRAVARTGQYLVRESEQGITDRVSLVLDTDARWHSPGEPSETFERAVRAVASLGVRHLGDGFGVTVETNGRRVADGLRSQRHRIALLDALARAERETVALTTALTRVAADARRDVHTVVVTPHLDHEAAGWLRLLVQRGASLLVALVLWEDSDPASAQRAAALGGNVVELTGRGPLDAAFGRVVGAGSRREGA